MTPVVLLILAALLLVLVRSFILRRRKMLKGLPVRGPWRWPRRSS
ncbi:MAG: hypothetical protein ABIX44_00005 [Cryobacterium sp.]